MDSRKVTVDNLNDVMEFDRVIRVNEDGTVSYASAERAYAPELCAINDGDGSHTAETDPDLKRQAADAGWELESGWTGQYAYHGVCMHASEYVGGRLARHILATPGYWVVVAVYEDDDSGPDSWAVAYRESLT